MSTINKLKATIEAQKYELREARQAETAAFIRGSAEMLQSIFAVCVDDDMVAWLNKRLQSTRGRPPTQAQRDLAYPEAIETAKRIGLDALGPTAIVELMQEQVGERAKLPYYPTEVL